MNAIIPIAIWRYCLARLQEASTWRGLILLATVAGVQVTDAQVATVIQVGLALAGAVAVLFPDKQPQP
ncbi:hypothetical protein UFOVP605_48 [uncultured Caudovirales phage]|uniref:Uncharacterized protein n=1 Tax=uncultured Caudovirales phage TaxID=2100421 RepID=A0A6J5N805_9CAUD|nr:hypothetical protein UFOVP605_48 [uncultured Caudovirales phage]